MILITRPKEQSQDLILELETKGFIVFQESLYKIKYDKIKINYDKNTYYIFPSINSVNSLVKNNEIKKFIGANILVIGTTVKKALQNLGCKKILASTKDSSELIKVLHQSKFLNVKFIYLCSNIINTDFFNKVKKHKINIHKKIVYKTLPRLKLTNKLINSLKLGHITAALFYSKLAAETFLRLIIKQQLQKKTKELEIFCLSERIAAPFKKKLFIYVNIATQPNQTAMIAKLIEKRNFL